MAAPRFSIGIDLGTTNSALSYVALDGDALPTVLPVPQWESLAGLAEASTLPSFLYLPEDAVAAQLQGRAQGTGDWIVGRFARAKVGETPDRVVHSAKSWLIHHAADRLSPFLPWGSSELSRDRKISPVRASALILNYLRGAWNDRFAAAGAPFNEQLITVTVPASFDAAAQRLTLTAAEEAGFPDGVRLLEEPQAAFYCWLQHHDPARDVWPEPAAMQPRHVLVVDIGGGTSDFSLFELRRASGFPIPAISRIAVSDHILLGGDNIDLALAHFVERQFTGGATGQLSGGEWDQLVAACRTLKERALATPGGPEEAFPVAIAGRGAGLLAAARTATVTRADIERVLLAGFFPDCDRSARPSQLQGGLREWGLPYASDTAVTRHLADFLRDRPRVDAVLFNGGSVTPASLRQRITAQIGLWQDGAVPLELANAEPALAVAHGAARFGALLHRHTAHIAAGAARAIFLDVQVRPGETALVCVLPRGAAPEAAFEISVPDLSVRIDQPVRFRAFSSARHGRAKAGDLLDWREGDFHPLPPLQTVVRTEGGNRRKDTGSIPVRLTAKINALGLLQVSCESTDKSTGPAHPRSWPLEFNLRAVEQANPAASAPPVEPNTDAEALNAAKARLTAIFSRPAGATKLAAGPILQQIERLTGQPRAGWNAPTLRALWPSLAAQSDGRKRSVEHEEAWLSLAGFLLRPGFGVIGDELRMDSLWRVQQEGAAHPGKRIRTQEYLMWRRVAGGLSADRQSALLAGEMDRLRGGKAPDELVRLVGALEFLPLEAKTELAEAFITVASTLLAEKRQCAPYFNALGRLLSRAPLRAGPETVLPAGLVERAFDAFDNYDWSEAAFSELQPMFLRAARVTGDRTLDVPAKVRTAIAAKLEKAGVPERRTGRIRGFVAIDRTERASLYDESLPAGLVLGGDASGA
ncbi:hsp70 family protein [Rhodopila sp.]|uniref:hsp70 family protein n=1 Tax=Rhodopila sp. TaxID=2480087 RepID=UPI002BA0999C|nr:Hsp70 family protein [Rhodopila sp.]HVZ07283.1 Hsp70 family protein [Rhodopila sp.]